EVRERRGVRRERDVTAGGVGDHAGNAHLLEQTAGLVAGEARVARLQRGTDPRPRRGGRTPRPRGPARGGRRGAAGQPPRRRPPARQKLEERGDDVTVKTEAWRQLPEDRSQRIAEEERPGREEVGERGAHVAKLLHVGDVAAALHGEAKAVDGLDG